MGFVSNVLVQGIISFVIIGSLKRAGVVRCAGCSPLSLEAARRVLVCSQN